MFELLQMGPHPLPLSRTKAGMKELSKSKRRLYQASSNDFVYRTFCYQYFHVLPVYMIQPSNELASFSSTQPNY